MPEESHDLSTIQRKKAKSGKLSYGDPVVLFESSKRKIVFVPFFIPRTEHTELSVKLITYIKQVPPMDWAVLEEKSLSMNEQASRALLKQLSEHFAVASEDSDGDYLVIKVSEGTASIGHHDPSQVASALTKVLGQQEIVEHLKGTELTSELMGAFKGAIRLSEMKNAVEVLRHNLNSGITAETIYQKWCNEHPWAFGNAHVMPDDVREISNGDKLDMLLPTVIAGYRDVVELKRPDMNVIKYDSDHKNYYFASEVSKAIGQCHRYLDVLHEVAANGLRDHPEIVAYHPRALIIIGRSYGWSKEQLKALHGLNQRLSGIMVMTYDHLLAQGERLINSLNPSPETVDESDEIDTLEDLDSDFAF